MTNPQHNSGRNQVCELDHLVPLELGGADGMGNIWPQCGPDDMTLKNRYFKIKDRVENYLADEVKAERLQRLQALITRGQRAFNAACAGRTLEVLLEKPGKLPGQLVGKSPYLQAVQVMAPRARIGSLARVTVTEIGSNTLFGALAEAPQRTAVGA